MTAAGGEQIVSVDATSDDRVLPFVTELSGVRGRVVKLGASIDTILARHDYPEAVSKALGEVLAFTALVGSAIAPGHRLGLQFRTDGAIRFLFADCEAPGRLRATASFDRDKVQSMASSSDAAARRALLGTGHLALTLDRGAGEEPRQGIIPFEGDSLSAAATAFFEQSEQRPSYVRLAVARVREAGSDGWHWRAGGLLIQKPLDDGDDAAAAGTSGDREEDWQRVRILAATVEDHELVDPRLPSERLLIRLFHEEGVRAFSAVPFEAHCRCSRDRVKMFLTRFGAQELADLKDDSGQLTVTCEFCNANYRFEPTEFE